MVESITLINTVKGTRHTLDQKRGSQYLLESCDWGVVTSNRVTYKYTNQVGVQVTNTTLETRDVSIVGWICSENAGELEALAKTLNKFINPMEAMKLQYKNYELGFFPDNSIKWGKSIKENNEYMRKFKIDGFAADPLFRTISDSRVTAGVIESKFFFPLVIPKDEGIVFGIRREYIILSVPNAGDVTTGFKIEFLASKGTVTNPALYNTKTQEYIKINKTLERGEKIVINTLDGEKSVIGYEFGSDEPLNYYKYKDLLSTWLVINAGDNLFKYDADDNVVNLEVRIYYNNRYLEVE